MMPSAHRLPQHKGNTMTHSFELLSALASRPENHSLSRDFYCDSQIYQADLHAIWYQSWIFAGHSGEVIISGASLSFPLADYTINISRDANGLVATAQNSGASKVIHCREVSGYIFISLANQPDDFEAFAQTVAPYLKPHDIEHLKVAAESSIVEYGNWKLVLENNRECYHCLSNHPELIITYPEDPAVTGTDADAEVPEMVAQHWQACEKVRLPSTFQLSEDGTYRVARMPLLEDFRSYTMTGEDAVHRRIGDFGGKLEGCNPGALVMFHYPSTWNHCLDDHVISFRVVPLGPQATLVTTKWLVHADATEGVDYDLNNLIHVWEQTNSQDKQLVEENQQGINSPDYESGPYSSVYESGVIQFVDWYGDTLKQRLGADNR